MTLTLTEQEKAILRMGDDEYSAWLKKTQQKLFEQAAKGRRSAAAGGLTFRATPGEVVTMTTGTTDDPRTALLGAIEKKYAAERGGTTTKRDGIRAAEATVRAACADRIYDGETIRTLTRLAILRQRAA